MVRQWLFFLYKSVGELVEFLLVANSKFYHNILFVRENRLIVHFQCLCDVKIVKSGIGGVYDF